MTPTPDLAPLLGRNPSYDVEIAARNVERLLFDLEAAAGLPRAQEDQQLVLRNGQRIVGGRIGETGHGGEDIATRPHHVVGVVTSDRESCLPATVFVARPYLG